MNEGGIKGKESRDEARMENWKRIKIKKEKTTVKKEKGIVGSRKFVGSLQFVGKKIGKEK